MRRINLSLHAQCVCVSSLFFHENCNLRDASMLTGSRRTRSEMIDFSDEDDLSNVNVKSLVSCAHLNLYTLKIDRARCKLNAQRDARSRRIVRLSISFGRLTLSRN